MIFTPSPPRALPTLTGEDPSVPQEAPTEPLQPIPLAAIRLADAGFWGQRRRTNRLVTLTSQARLLQADGRNLPLEPGASGQRHPFWDSDLAKWLEAVAEEQQAGTCPPAILAEARTLLQAVAASQDDDGYIVTWMRFAPQRRYTDLRLGHELYTMGHLLEACCAWVDAIQEPAALGMATRLIDHLWRAFGPDGRPGYCGHPEIELALMRWWRRSGDERARTLAALMVDRRGTQPALFVEERLGRPAAEFAHLPACLEPLSYYQAHLPVREQTSCVGHAVRALYLYAGMTDLALAGDATLRPVLERLWADATERHLYVTGGMGAVADGERFGSDYQLPDATGYCETCASIALARWAQRMLQLELRPAYAEVLELALHNTVLSGVSLEGDRYFYANPLAITPEVVRSEDHITSGRKPWFGCACCPPNVARTLSQLGGFAASQDGRQVVIHLYLPGTIASSLGGVPLTLAVETALPWEGTVRITVQPERSVAGAITLRIPAWCEEPRLVVAGQEQAVQPGSYVRLERTWRAGDDIQLTLPMPIRRQHAHPAVRAVAGRVAVQRGPLVYAWEEVDNGSYLEDVALADDAPITPGADPRLGGCIVLRAVGTRTQASSWDGPLYRPSPAAREPVTLTAVPYCTWGNRSPGEMRVWLRRG